MSEWREATIGDLCETVSITYKRKGEAEISQSLVEIPLFKFGVLMVMLGLVMKLIF